LYTILIVLFFILFTIYFKIETIIIYKSILKQVKLIIKEIDNV